MTNATKEAQMELAPAKEAQASKLVQEPAKTATDSLRIYRQVCTTPNEARKTITGGRLNGMTDINPMWRIKTLTEVFGPCGEGWNIINVRYEQVCPKDTQEVVTFCHVELVYRKADGTWSEPIYGIGGSRLLVAERNGMYLDDECFKKAYTDAISIACKMLGMSADIYYAKDRTKYTAPVVSDPVPAQSPKQWLMSEIKAINDACNDKEAFVTIRKSLIADGLLQDKKSEDMTRPEMSEMISLVKERAVSSGKCQPFTSNPFVKNARKEA